VRVVELMNASLDFVRNLNGFRDDDDLSFSNNSREEPTARSAIKLSSALNAITEAETKSLPSSTQLGINSLRHRFDSLIRRWKWDEIIGPDGESRVAEGLKGLAEKRRRFLAAVLSCVTNGVEGLPSGYLDYADSAREEGVEPTMPYADAKAGVQPLWEAWRFTPFLGDELPTCTSDDCADVERAIRNIERGMRRMRSSGTGTIAQRKDTALARSDTFLHTQPQQYLKRLDGGTALIDVRHLDPQKTWLGVPVQAAMLYPDPSDWTGVFGVNLYLYRGIWICSCWIEGKPGYYKHPLFSEDWLEQVTFWEVTEAGARRWFKENHQPIADELKGVESGPRAETNNQPGHPAPPAGPPVGSVGAAAGLIRPSGDLTTAGATHPAKGKPVVSQRRPGQELTADEKRLYKQIIGALKKLPHGTTSKKAKIAEKLRVGIELVVKADKWGRKHGLL
jgi:hypothetical protein